ncbi:hypothetical protein PIB30_014230 [Stylosanthes scabra]|uniref:Uncharacterized protein n=1 Tax=Stylosanthes scabra TaxID=79078 RepID=A0ABU6X6T0_9FABA|nr:hypothetical protein [Stylosanthes scabra]
MVAMHTREGNGAFNYNDGSITTRAGVSPLPASLFVKFKNKLRLAAATNLKEPRADQLRPLSPLQSQTDQPSDAWTKLLPAQLQPSSPPLSLSKNAADETTNARPASLGFSSAPPPPSYHVADEKMKVTPATGLTAASLSTSLNESPFKLRHPSFSSSRLQGVLG